MRARRSRSTSTIRKICAAGGAFRRENHDPGRLDQGGRRAGSIAKARDVFQQLHLAREKGLYIRKTEFNFALESVAKGTEIKLPDLHAARIQISAKKPPIIPKSLQQKKYVEAVKTHDLIFGVGPAGTGKTFLAMAMAVAALKNEEVNRIVLTRPAVEAGEALGFCPAISRKKSFPICARFMTP
jgi:phosphate starvation-inducible PhoH-like protein